MLVDFGVNVVGSTDGLTVSGSAVNHGPTEVFGDVYRIIIDGLQKL